MQVCCQGCGPDSCCQGCTQVVCFSSNSMAHPCAGHAPTAAASGSRQGAQAKGLARPARQQWQLDQGPADVAGGGGVQESHGFPLTFVSAALASSRLCATHP
eukprot:365811-Chlamydomonas_euryale.AAC.28